MAPEDLNKFVADAAEVAGKQQAEIEALQTQFAGMVKYINDTVKKISQTVDAVDSTAFAAFGILALEGKVLELTTENIMTVRENMKQNFSKFSEYREQLAASIEKDKAKALKAQAKKEAVQAKRDAKKGRTKKVKDAKEA